MANFDLRRIEIRLEFKHNCCKEHNNFGKVSSDSEPKLDAQVFLRVEAAAP